MPEEAGASPEPSPLSRVLEQEYASLGRGVGGDGEAADEASRLRGLYRWIHGAEPLSALCISGGGIRSATFALGAIQELGRRGLLSSFDYLSTVSGGGYIGSWLSAWIHRAQGLSDVLPRLTAPPGGGASASGSCDPVEHLREYNSYLTPKLGLASADTWTLAAIMLRNLLLNWLLLIPLLMAALMSPRVLVALLQVRPATGSDPFASFDTLQAAVLVAGVLLFAFSTFFAFGALPSVGLRPLTEAQFVRRCLVPQLLSGVFLTVGFWWSWDDFQRRPGFAELAGGGALVALLGWVACLVVSDLFRDLRRFARRLFGPLTVASVVFGFCSGAAAWMCIHPLFDTAHNQDDPSFYATLTPALFLGGLLLGQALAVGFTSHTLSEPDREWAARAGAFTLLAAFGWLLLCGVVLVIPHLVFGWGAREHSLMALLGGISGWITAFPRGRAPSAGANAGTGTGSAAAELARKASLPVFVLLLMIGLTVLTNGILTAVGAVDASFWQHEAVVEHSSLLANLGLTAALVAFALLVGRYVNVNTFSLHTMYRNRLVRAYLAASNAGRRPSFTGFDDSDDIPMERLRGQRPLHVLNLALNLVSTQKLSWQQRKAESFTVTPFAAGSRGLGYRDSARYGGPHGISLATAMTISGAAASPNMGYHSSPLVGFTMMLFNARLGWWLGNPGRAGDKTWPDDGPRSAVAAVVRELLGLTDDCSPYVYLSDGGHFENLALYEMVLRRCRTVVVLDAGCDPGFTYEDLGNALRKIRIDFGIPIEFEDGAFDPLRSKQRRCAVAQIRYSAVDQTQTDGRLVYLKPILLGSEPPDVQSYAAANPTFPHETTGNQWFNESQTESYRMLGQFTVAEVCGGWVGGSLEQFADHVTDGPVRAAVAASAAPSATAR